MYCIDILTSLKKEPTTKEMVAILNNTWNIIYFGQIPDNDSDGNDELLHDALIIRLAGENAQNLSQNAFENYLRGKLLCNNKISIQPFIEVIEDKGETKTDIIITLYVD